MLLKIFCFCYCCFVCDSMMWFKARSVSALQNIISLSLVCISWRFPVISSQAMCCLKGFLRKKKKKWNLKVEDNIFAAPYSLSVAAYKSANLGGSLILKNTSKTLWIPHKKHYTYHGCHPHPSAEHFERQYNIQYNTTINQKTWAIHENIWQLQFFHLYSEVIIHNGESTQHVPKKIK